MAIRLVPGSFTDGETLGTYLTYFDDQLRSESIQAKKCDGCDMQVPRHSNIGAVLPE